MRILLALAAGMGTVACLCYLGAAFIVVTNIQLPNWAFAIVGLAACAVAAMTYRRVDP